MPAEPSPPRPQPLNTYPPSQKPDSLFVKATIFGVKLECLVDTGSTSTILHSGKYFEIPEHMRPKLNPSSSTLRVADGGLVKPLGHATFPLLIDNQEYQQNLIVVPNI